MFRGQNSLRNWVRNGFAVYEMPSVVLPINFIIATLTGLAMLPMRVLDALVLLLWGAIGPLMMTFRARKAFVNKKQIIQAFVIACTYYTARGLASFRELFGYLRGNFGRRI